MSTPSPPGQIVLKIAETKEELSACFSLLHDAYVESGFMEPSPSGMRVTVYHALPTTTTLCAKIDGIVVGTVSLIRESAFGFPMQQIFDLKEIRAKGGQVAEVSALAVHSDYRSGTKVLFPLVRLMYEYCRGFFDTQHLVIAVNPRHIQMYERTLCFSRLNEMPVSRYDFVNGAPAVGASISLLEAPGLFLSRYGKKSASRNLHHLFCESPLLGLDLPDRRYFTTNHPVMTPALMDYFFNERTTVFEDLNERSKALLRLIYDPAAYLSVLPSLLPGAPETLVRSHWRFSVKCPGFLVERTPDGKVVKIEINNVSRHGFSATCSEDLNPVSQFDATICLGATEDSRLVVRKVRGENAIDSQCGFFVIEEDSAWKNFVTKLYQAHTYADLLVEDLIDNEDDDAAA